MIAKPTPRVPQSVKSGKTGFHPSTTAGTTSVCTSLEHLKFRKSNPDSNYIVTLNQYFKILSKIYAKVFGK